jgi:membrane associated rhomboid family serine protease
LFPLRDSPSTHRFPFVNIALIALNLYLFLRQVFMPDTQLIMFVHTYGLIPARILAETTAGNLLGFIPLLSYQFLHGGWLHVGTNMLYLWVFGDNIEDRLGHFRYLVFYLLLGVLAGMVQIMADARSLVPIIGASGSVAGILGAYLVSCPKARVLALVPIVFLIPVELPAVIFLGFWFILQVFSGVASVGMEVAIAWWAHVGGFMAGVLLVNFFGKKIDCE